MSMQNRGIQIQREAEGWIEKKGMTFDHDFGYSFPRLSYLLKKREEEKENEKQKS